MEQHLAGGFVTAVTRVDDTVRRLPSSNAGFVHELLLHFERQGWSGAPRYLGTDADGREILSFIDGHVAWESDQPPGVHCDESVAAVAGLVREFHDLTAGTPLAGRAEVVCHNDLSPKNTVYQHVGGEFHPTAFIDWDIAAPGARIHDLAHVGWQFLALGPAGPDVAEAGRGLRLLCDSYGLDDRRPMISTILWWQERCWRGIEGRADAGDPAMQRLRQNGAANSVRAAHRWTRANCDQLKAAMG